MTDRILHALERLGYGPRPGDRARVRAHGLETYLHAQLHPDGREPDALAAALGAMDTLALTPAQLFGDYAPHRSPFGTPPDAAARKAARRRARVVYRQAAAARLLRAAASPHQLQEVMVDFWFNHFNVFARKGLDNLWIGAYENEAIRPHALGRFRDLLLATARHPAMLFYLDNWLNTAPGSPGARGRFQGINENYAREVMELHTLGVNGGYTQADVIALAHILTGWGLRPGVGFRFDARRHDFTDKRWLGRTIRGAGESEGVEALTLLARHPATARHVSYQLAQYLVADTPPPALVEHLSRVFLERDGDIRAWLLALFERHEFWAPDHVGNKFKTPYRYVLSALRAGGVRLGNTRPLQGMLYALGQPLYGCLTPDGYANTGAAWLDPAGLMQRLNFATALGAGYLPLDPDRPPHTPLDADMLLDALGPRVSSATRAAAQGSPQPLRAAVILGSPEFMYC